MKKNIESCHRIKSMWKKGTTRASSVSETLIRHGILSIMTLSSKKDSVSKFSKQDGTNVRERQNVTASKLRDGTN